MNKAVFLDRDGTINVEKQYLFKTEEFEFIPRAPMAIKKMNDLGYKVIIISNQSGIARGFFTEQDVINLHKYMLQELDKIGAKIDGFYYCPHHPEAKIEKYRLKCKCRKPENALFVKAIEKYEIDVSKSWVVGDRVRDLIPGEVLGMRGALVLTGYGKEEQLRNEAEENRIFKDLYEFVIKCL